METAESQGNPWLSGINSNLCELTQGFEDNFVEIWGQPEAPVHDANRNVFGDVLGSPLGSPLFFEKEQEFGFCFEDESDLVFRTIPGKPSNMYTTLITRQLTRLSPVQMWLKCLYSYILML